MVRGGEHFVPRPCWYLHSSMPEDISGIFWRLPKVKDKECEQVGIEVTFLLTLSCTTRPWLPCMRAQIIKY
jgi:hypothetical protein